MPNAPSWEDDCRNDRAPQSRWDDAVAAFERAVALRAARDRESFTLANTYRLMRDTIASTA